MQSVGAFLSSASNSNSRGSSKIDLAHFSFDARGSIRVRISREKGEFCSRAFRIFNHIISPARTNGDADGAYIDDFYVHIFCLVRIEPRRIPFQPILSSSYTFSFSHPVSRRHWSFGFSGAGECVRASCAAIAFQFSPAVSAVPDTHTHSSPQAAHRMCGGVAWRAYFCKVPTKWAIDAGSDVMRSI